MRSITFITPSTLESKSHSAIMTHFLRSIRAPQSLCLSHSLSSVRGRTFCTYPTLLLLLLLLRCCRPGCYAMSKLKGEGRCSVSNPPPQTKCKKGPGTSLNQDHEHHHTSYINKKIFRILSMGKTLVKAQNALECGRKKRKKKNTAYNPPTPKPLKGTSCGVITQSC